MPAFDAIHQGERGHLVFDDGLVWRTADAEERIDGPALLHLSAGRVRPGGSWWLVAGLGWMVAARALDLSVFAALGALWVVASLRIVWSTHRAEHVVTWTRRDDPDTTQVAQVTGRGVLEAVTALRATLPSPGATSLDETWSAQVSHLSGPSLAQRGIALWMLTWLSTAPVWVALWALAFGGAWSRGDPVGDTFVVLLMGPPFVALLWPLPVLLGLFLQLPFARLLVRWAAPPPGAGRPGDGPDR